MEFVHGLLLGLGIGVVGIILTFLYYRRITATLAKDLELVKSNIQLKVNKIP